MIIQPSRRGFVLGLGALIAAPAVVRAGWIMPVKKWIEPTDGWTHEQVHAEPMHVSITPIFHGLSPGNIISLGGGTSGPRGTFIVKRCDPVRVMLSPYPEPPDAILSLTEFSIPSVPTRHQH